MNHYMTRRQLFEYGDDGSLTIWENGKARHFSKDEVRRGEHKQYGHNLRQPNPDIETDPNTKAI